jgi:GT2 family glycosyltransferase
MSQLTPETPDLSISIINTNNRAIALQCLESVFANQEGLKLEVIVVNNACTDGSTAAIQARFPQARIIENERMLGFSSNNNLALTGSVDGSVFFTANPQPHGGRGDGVAQGRYWMLLNDDTIVQPGAFQAMVAFMDQHPQAGVVGAALLNKDGSPQLCYDYIPHPLYEGLRPLSEYLRPPPKSHGQPLETGYVGGACLMVRASAIQRNYCSAAIGVLDRRFDPLYSEEVDWCYRFIQAGWKIYHLPQARVIHLGEVAKRRTSLQRYERIYAKKAIFFRKHSGVSGARIYKVVLWVSNLIKAILWLALWALRRPGARQEFEIHWNIVRWAFKF